MYLADMDTLMNMNTAKICQFLLKLYIYRFLHANINYFKVSQIPYFSEKYELSNNLAHYLSLVARNGWGG